MFVICPRNLRVHSCYRLDYSLDARHHLEACRHSNTYIYDDHRGLVSSRGCHSFGHDFLVARALALVTRPWRDLLEQRASGLLGILLCVQRHDGSQQV